MNLQENIEKIKSVINTICETEEEKIDDTVNMQGKLIDLDNLSDKEKKVLDLKEKIVVDNNQLEYPIVLIQLRNGKVIVFDVDGTVKDLEENKNV